MTGADERAALAEELAELDRLPVSLTREEAWTFLRVTDRHLDRMLERGELARRRFGTRTLIPRASVRAWILRQAGVEPSPNGGGDLVDAAARFQGTVPPTERTTT
jgi:excisionase family DNA binding protein